MNIYKFGKLQILNILSCNNTFMVKVKRITGRGTGAKEAEVEDQKWAGDAYREEQEKRKTKAGNTTVTTKRGTRKMKLKDLPEPRARKSTEGRTRVTARGTSSRKSTNKGSK